MNLLPLEDHSYFYVWSRLFIVADKIINNANTIGTKLLQIT